MIRFIRYFIMEWMNYPYYHWFTHEYTKPEVLEQMGGDPYKNRFDYAWRNAAVHWKHLDRYSRKCTGDCLACTANGSCKVISEETSVDSIMTSGMYYSAHWSNTPNGSLYGYLWVSGTGNVARQMFFAASANATYTRAFSTVSWSDWERIDILRNEVTVTLSSNVSSGTITCRARGAIVSMHGYCIPKIPTSNSWVTVGTISIRRPSEEVRGTCMNFNNSLGGIVRVTTSGEVQMYIQASAASGNSYTFNLTYIINE